MVVEGWLTRAAAGRPEHTALQADDGACTYGELLDAARIGAHELHAHGARPGEQVAIALPGGLGFAQALHACLLLGAVAVPVDVRAPAREREQMSAGAGVVVNEPLSRDRGRSRASQPEPARARRHDLAAPAVVMHTSGTSGSPRAVELTYGNLLWSALGSAAALDLDARERWLCALPVCHVGGLSILVRSAIYATTAVVHARFDADHALAALREERITLVSVVATTLTRLLDAGLARPPSLRCALTGGGPVPSPLVDRADEAEVPLSLTYGLTEACSQVTTTPVCELGRGGPAPGPPLFCTRVAVAGERVTTAPAGEILVAGPTVAPGAVEGDGWLHTGDLGRIDERGRLHVTGRCSEVIISGGENVAPAEVEAVLEAHPDVLEAAVLGRADGEWGEAVTALVVARPGCAPGPQELRDHCAGALAPYKVPREIVLREGPLPRTSSGKLARAQLKRGGVG
jgi:O-succinylbenzoic acid--CoA ligase